MTTTKLSDKISLDKIIWPIARDGYIPNSVVRNLAPFPKFSGHCVDNRLHVEDRTLISKKQFRMHFPPKENQQNNEDHQGGSENGLQSVPEETTGYPRPSLEEPFHSDMSVKTETEAKVTPLRRAIPQSQHLLNNRQKLLQQNVASNKTLQTNASSVEELQMNASSVEELQTKASSVEDLQTKASSVEELQTNASSVDELKNEEDVDFPHPPEIVPQSLSAESNAFPTNKGKKVRLNLPKGLSLSPMLQQEKDEVQLEKDGSKQEIASSSKEPKKSFQGRIEKNGHVAEIGDQEQNMRQKTNFSSKKPYVPKSKPPSSVLMYLYRRARAEAKAEAKAKAKAEAEAEAEAESSPSDGVKSKRRG